MRRQPVCARCGAPIEPRRHRQRCLCGAVVVVAQDVTSALLSKLSQLTRFGLAAEDPPLLESVQED